MSPAPAAGASSTAQRAGLARRLAASLYEALVLTALALAIALVLLPWLGPDTASAAADGPLPLPGQIARAALLACLLCASGAYCIWLWSGGRRSLPMRTWRVALRTAVGRDVSPARAAARYLFGWIGPAAAIAAYLALRPSGHARWAAALLALNYAWSLIDPDRRYLHDRLAATRLVRDPGRRRPEAQNPDLGRAR